MYEILDKQKIAPAIYSMTIDAPEIAKKAQPGQFIILRTDEEGERIPLTIADYNRDNGIVRIIYQVVGLTTKQLSEMSVGDCLATFAGPLGQPSELDATKRVLCIGGGVGTAVVYPMIKELNAMGALVDVITGARNKEHVILQNELKANCHHLYITTDDGSLGQQGFVTDVLKQLVENGEQYDEVIAIGPLVMMKFVSLLTKEYNIKTTVSLNPIMVDGTGMCGGCRVTVGGKTKYACVDGPDFDGHAVDFDQAMLRQTTYKNQEATLVEHHCKGGLFGND